MIELQNCTGKELHLYLTSGEVIDFPKSDYVITDKSISTKSKIIQTNFGDLIITNMCPVKNIRDILPSIKNDIYSIVSQNIAERYQRPDFIYPEDRFFEDEYHIKFRNFAAFNFFDNKE